MPLAGRALIIAGAILVLAGVLLSFGPKIPLLGRLPGDFVVKREHVTVYVPLATCILLSVVITLLLRLLGK